MPEDIPSQYLVINLVRPKGSKVMYSFTYHDNDHEITSEQSKLFKEVDLDSLCSGLLKFALENLINLESVTLTMDPYQHDPLIRLKERIKEHVGVKIKSGDIIKPLFYNFIDKGFSFTGLETALKHYSSHKD
jgi:hypothetical protein